MTEVRFPAVEYNVGRGRVAVDLRCVAAVRPWYDGAAKISLYGSNEWIDILADYEDVLRDWMRAKDAR